MWQSTRDTAHIAIGLTEKRFSQVTILAQNEKLWKA